MERSCRSTSGLTRKRLRIHGIHSGIIAFNLTDHGYPPPPRPPAESKRPATRNAAHAPHGAAPWAFCPAADLKACVSHTCGCTRRPGRTPPESSPSQASTLLGNDEKSPGSTPTSIAHPSRNPPSSIFRPGYLFKWRDHPPSGYILHGAMRELVSHRPAMYTLISNRTIHAQLFPGAQALLSLFPGRSAASRAGFIASPRDAPQFNPEERRTLRSPGGGASLLP